ncbi:pilus assembly protein TadG-related protein [Pseudarthrobacter sp. NPDC058329]|uniref:TadE/TadG family type IV pilus assembly protein n=1 Tax=Pseudarthrobacter sp. NPDC058329 TaxID=3346448 RepID=UPI0036D957C9
MRRLKKAYGADRAGERGAAGVTVAVMMLALIGAGAMAVDVGQIYSERAQLQNGADAGALAVAASCQAGACNSSLAGSFANANSNDNASDVAVDLSATGQVTVSTSTRTGSSSFLTNLFATALDAGPVQVGASATAAWGAPGYGPAALPLTFAPCQFDIGGGLQTITIHGTETCVSDSPSGASVAGGFEWLVPDAGVCGTTVRPDDPATPGVTDPYSQSKTGLSMPSTCKPVIETLLNTVVLFPVYSSVVKTGANAKYYIKGYAAFKLAGYRFPGMSGGDMAGLGGSDNGIRGQFVTWVADPTTYSGGGYSGGGVSLPAHLIN